MRYTIKDILQKVKENIYYLNKGINNLYRWFTTIWRDRDWDYYYLDKLVLTKLDQMANSFAQQGIRVDADEQVRRIRQAHHLLSKVMESYYEMEYMEYYQQDFNITEEGEIKWIEPIVDNLGQYFDKYPRIYKQAVKSLSKIESVSSLDNTRVIIAIKMSNLNQVRARNLAYKIISTYSPTWWD